MRIASVFVKLRRSITFCWVLALLILAPGLVSTPALSQALAQGQNLPLPADLFVLNNLGQVMHIAAGSSFAQPVTPVEQIVVDFGVAPDGQWIAYRTTANPDGTGGAFIAITAVGGLSGQLLEFESAGQPPITGHGQTLAWAPDGTLVAYTTGAGLRIYLPGAGESGEALFQDHAGGPFLNLIWSPGGGYLAAEAESNVWNIYRRQGADGPGLAYAGQIPASAGLAWTQEGVLALAPPVGGLVLLNLLDGSQNTLIEPPMVVSQPTLVGRGRLTFLIHEASGQRFAARRFGTISTIGGDFQEFEASLELTADMRWLPDGQALLSAEDGTLTIIEPRTNTRREIIGEVKAYGWGPLPPAELAGLTLPADLYFLSRDDVGVAQLWRLPADGRPAEQLTIEPSSVLDFTLSPDGGQIAYTAGGSLIVANSDGSAGREVSPVAERPGAGAQPAWSPNRALIAYVRDGIWLVPANGGARTELITDNLGADTPPDQVRVYMRPRWSPNNTMLLVDVGLYEGVMQAILPITGGETFPLPTGTNGGAWLPNGQVLTWGSGFAYVTPGLYLVNPADLSASTTILNEAWHVSDAVPLANEAAAILSSPGGDVMGPNTVQPYLVPILPDALPIPNGQGGLIEAPVLSPDGGFAAGLRAASYGDFGLAGRLVLINLASGERLAIQTPGEVWGLQWGRMSN